MKKKCISMIGSGKIFTMNKTNKVLMHNKEFLQTDETKERNGNRCE